jgi:hypothetical protein
MRVRVFQSWISGLEDMRSCIVGSSTPEPLLSRDDGMVEVKQSGFQSGIWLYLDDNNVLGIITRPSCLTHFVTVH